MTKVSNKALKLVACLLTLVIFVGFTTGLKASASWYGWTYATFSKGLYSDSHYFDGNNVGLNWGSDTHNSVPNHINNNGGFDIKLQKQNSFGGWTDLGTYRASRSGSGGATWTNVGPGTYRFRFTKAIDGTTQYVTDIEMFSW